MRYVLIRWHQFTGASTFSSVPTCRESCKILTSTGQKFICFLWPCFRIPVKVDNYFKIYFGLIISTYNWNSLRNQTRRGRLECCQYYKGRVVNVAVTHSLCTTIAATKNYFVPVSESNALFTFCFIFNWLLILLFS